MKKILFPLMLLIAVILLESCTSGKQAYEKGNYDEAVLKAISRLRKNTSNKKASQTLMEAYPMTIAWHRDNIERAKQSGDHFKWERVINEYHQVNNLYSQLNRCPACLRLVNSPVRYVSELSDAKEKAASIRYQRGDELLVRARSNHNRNEAIEAYRHFEIACNLMGEYRDARDKLAEAKFIATLKVVVEPIPAQRNLQISHEFFENKILEFVESMQVNEFVQFYSTEAKNIGLDQPDQIIQLQFDDFVLGQVYLKEKEVQVSRDSVVLAIIKAQNSKISPDLLVANVFPDSPYRALRYFQAAPVIASPVLKNDSYYSESGNNNKKVTICHKIPGSLGKSQTISISKNALAHHLDHGDIQGTCNGEEDPQQKEATKSATGSSTTSSNTSGSVNNTTPTQSSGTGSQNSGTTVDNQASNSNGTTTNSTISGSQTSNSGSSQSTSGYTGANLGNIQNNHGNTVTTTNSSSTVDSEPPTTRKVYGTVKATVHVFNKSLSSRGILDFKIIDAHNQRVLTQEKMPGEFVWYTEWAYFNGDERALDDYFLEIVKFKEAYPPPPQDLFVAFTQPIFGQITSKIRDFYRNY